MIAIQAIALAAIRRFLSLRPDGSFRSGREQSECSAIIGVSLENLSETSESTAAVVRSSEPLRSCGAPEEDKITWLSVNSVLKTTAQPDINCISSMLRLFDSKIESNPCRFQKCDYAWQHLDARSTTKVQSALSVSRQKRFTAPHK
jgi:hypothetical protein